MFIKLIKTGIYCSLLTIILSGSLFVMNATLTTPLGLWAHQLIFLMIFGLIGNLYVLHQIPENLKQFETDTPFPTFYYVFTNAYLLPFSLIAIAVVYTVVASYIWQKNWPFIELPIIYCVIITTTLYLFVQYELLKTRTTNHVLKTALRYLYLLTLPLTLFFIAQITTLWLKEGITEFWYLLWLYFIWIALICLYFICSKRKDIRVIPFSLMTLIILINISILHPFSISVKSQHYHLIKTLDSEGQLTPDNYFILQESSTLSEQAKQILLNHIRYLEQHQQLHLLTQNYPYPIAKQSLTRQRLLSDLGINP